MTHMNSCAMDNKQSLHVQNDTHRSQLVRSPLRPLTLKVRFVQCPTISRAEIIQLVREQYGADAVRGIYCSGHSSTWNITCNREDIIDALLENGITYGDHEGMRYVAYLDNVTEPVKTIILRQLDPSISDDLIVEVLAKFGQIVSKVPLKRELEDGIENGCRIVKMTVREHIPQRIRFVSAHTKEETEFQVYYHNQLTNLKLYTHAI